MTNQTPDSFYVQEYWLIKMNPFERAEIMDMVRAENNGKIPSGIKGLRACHAKLAQVRKDKILTYQKEQILEDEKFEQELKDKGII